MSRAARTLVTFGVYLLGVGLVLLLTPDLLLSVLGLPQTDAPWIRIVGLLALVLAGYYIGCGKAETTAFFRASVPGRAFAAAGLLILAVVWGYWQLVLFAVVDGAGAMWTSLALRRPAEATTS